MGKHLKISEISTQNMVEKLTVVVVRLKTLFNCWSSLDSCINVAIVKFLVENQKRLIIIH
jgi:hypothetical protein